MRFMPKACVMIVGLLAGSTLLSSPGWAETITKTKIGNVHKAAHYITVPEPSCPNQGAGPQATAWCVGVCIEDIPGTGTPTILSWDVEMREVHTNDWRRKLELKWGNPGTPYGGGFYDFDKTPNFRATPKEPKFLIGRNGKRYICMTGINSSNNLDRDMKLTVTFEVH